MKIARLSIAIATFALLPAVLLAQSTIQGVVSDSSGAVIANATVVASSDVLIEKSRTVQTNGDGRYAIVDLRPGTYVVTATAPGFDTVRATLDMPANVSVPFDATLRPGSVGETVTVEARAATVDTENVAHPETLSRSEMDALPTARYMQAMAVYVPGAHLNLPDVGGSQQIEQNYISVHGNGSVHDTYMLDGLLVNTTYSDGQIQQYIDNASIQESTFQTSNVNALSSGGGMFTNLVPREGGNTYHGDFFAGGSGGSGFWQGTNLDDRLRSRGVAGQNKTVKIQDFNGAFGGAVIKDKLWFMLTGRAQTTFTEAGGSTYPDGRPGIQDGGIYSGTFRLTYQMNQKNKFSAFWLRNWKYKSHEILDGGQTGIPFDPSVASTQRTRWPLYYILQTKWTATPTARLVTELGMSLSHLDYNDLYQDGLEQTPFSAAWFKNTSQYDTGTSRRFVAGIRNQYFQTTRNYFGAAATYVTGSHQIKFGVQYSFGPAYYSSNANGDGWAQFSNGVPVSFLAFTTPFYQRPTLTGDIGPYITDTWHYKRLSVTAGIRFEYIAAKIQVEDAPAGRWTPKRHVDEVNCSNNPGMGCWKNFTPRIGIVYDLFGNHKTAIKAGFGKYNTQYSTSFTNPFNPMTSSTQTITWNGASLGARCTPITLRGIPTPNPDCYTTGTYGEQGLGVNPNPAFGTATVPKLDPNFKREYNLQYTVGLQQELRRGVTLNVNWYRRSSYQQVLLLNTAVGDSFWTKGSVINPLDGKSIPVFNLNAATNVLPAAKFYQTNAPRSKAGNTYSGFETSVTARLPKGIFGVFGWTIDRQLDRSCAQDFALSGGRNDPNSQRFCDWFGNLNQDLGAIGNLPRHHEFKVHGSIPIKWGVVASASLTSLRLQGGFSPNGSTSVVVNNGYLPRTWSINNATRYPVDCSSCPKVASTTNPGVLVGALVNPTMPAGQSISLNLVAPGEVLTDRLNQLDIGIKRVFKFKERYKLEPEVQFFNLMNSNAVISQGNAVPTSTSAGVPYTITNFLPGGVGGAVNNNTPPRIMRIALQFHF